MNATRWMWSVAGVVLLGFAIFEGVKYGWVATGVLVLFGLFPDIALIGAFAGHGLLKPRRVGFYNLLHRPWLPLALVLISFAPLPSLGWGLRSGLEVFLAGLAWLVHICVDRAAGLGLREPDGSIRPVGKSRTSTR